jgi:hypothetical protein
MGDFDSREALIARLGKVSTKGGCLYINRLDAVDEGVLRELVTASLAYMRASLTTNSNARGWRGRGHSRGR